MSNFSHCLVSVKIRLSCLLVLEKRCSLFKSPACLYICLPLSHPLPILFPLSPSNLVLSIATEFTRNEWFYLSSVLLSSCSHSLIASFLSLFFSHYFISLSLSFSLLPILFSLYFLLLHLLSLPFSLFYLLSLSFVLSHYFIYSLSLSLSHSKPLSLYVSTYHPNSLFPNKMSNNVCFRRRNVSVATRRRNFRPIGRNSIRHRLIFAPSKAKLQLGSNCVLVTSKSPSYKNSFGVDLRYRLNSSLLIGQ